MNEDERNWLIEEYGRGFELLTAAASEAPRIAWKFKPEPHEWSIHEILVHMADSEFIGITRLHMLIAEPGSTLMPYAEDKWAAALDYQNQDVDDALELFKLLRRTTHRLLKTLPNQVFLHSVAHPQLEEPYTLEKWLVIYTRHVSEHIEQLGRMHQVWREQHR